MHLLKTHNLTQRIANKIICNRLNLQINQGDIWGLLGANGSGKTTLLHTLANLRVATAGEIYLQEKIISSFSRKELARKIGVLFQDTHFVFPQSVFEFCESGRYPHKSNFTQHNRIVTEALMVMDLNTIASQNVLTLSGGEKRRLTISTLLAQQPQIYLLDEPTNHLDIKHQMSVLKHFKKLSATNPIGILMAIHDIHLAKQFCNKILMLFEEGETLQGNAEDLLSNENLSRLYQYPFPLTIST